ncbi:MAG: DDE-type integrase/transposase/recombinase, partial [Actinomycetota bacterium]|nr:DDE-type integrase/transposase/recombinase [Actinomycetota bacterium]
TATGPDQKWCADITYIETREGYLFLAVVSDAFSRRIVGWSMRDNLEAEIVADAIAMSVARRRPQPGVIHHSDRGSQVPLLRLHPGALRPRPACVLRLGRRRLRL